MEFRKIFQISLPMAYVASSLKINNEAYAVFASESEFQGQAIMIDSEFAASVLWESPGGCMGIVPFPDNEHDFLAIQKFYPVFKSEEAEIVWFHKTEDRWSPIKSIPLPFVHRIEIIRTSKSYFLLACTLCEKKRYVDDWSTPGKVYAFPISNTGHSIGKGIIILDGLFKNHGLVKSKLGEEIYVTHNEGVNRISFRNNDWVIDEIFKGPISDIALVDIDGDGEQEIGVITPFHGDKFEIYKKKGSSFNKVFSVSSSFAHAIWGGEINNTPVYLVGFRGGEKQLLAINNYQGQFRMYEIDRGIGPTNVTVFKNSHGEYIASSNRESDSCSIYEVL